MADRFVVTRIALADGITIEVTAVLPPPPPEPRRSARLYCVDGCQVFALETARRAA